MYLCVRFAGILSIDTLEVGGLSTTITFAAMETRSLDGCGTVDGIMGMGLAAEGDRQSVFEDLVEVRPTLLLSLPCPDMVSVELLGLFVETRAHFCLVFSRGGCRVAIACVWVWWPLTK